MKKSLKQEEERRARGEIFPQEDGDLPVSMHDRLRLEERKGGKENDRFEHMAHRRGGYCTRLEHMAHRDNCSIKYAST